MRKVFDKQKRNRIVIFNGIDEHMANFIGEQLCGFLNTRVKMAKNPGGVAYSFKTDDAHMFYIKGWVMQLQYDGEIPHHVQFLG